MAASRADTQPQQFRAPEGKIAGLSAAVRTAGLSSWESVTHRVPWAVPPFAASRTGPETLGARDAVWNVVATGCRALFDESHRHDQLARELGRELARRSYAVETGGGPGTMEAANRGRPGGRWPQHRLQHLLDFTSETMFEEGTAEEGGVGGILVTDSMAGAVEHIDRIIRSGDTPPQERKAWERAAGGRLTTPFQRAGGGSAGVGPGSPGARFPSTTTICGRRIPVGKSRV